MNIEFKQIKVYTHAKDKCLKITQGGKVIMYMKDPYYELPHYNYKVEEVDIEEGKSFFNKINNKVKHFFKGK